MATATPAPGDDRRREMSPDEKLIAQWEAQHDVAARGHRGDPLGLQRSISRERLADCARRTVPAPGTPASRSAAASRPAAGADDADWSAVCAPSPASPEPPPEQTGRRHAWWRLRHHASEH